jgi:hypothetical protein
MCSGDMATKSYFNLIFFNTRCTTALSVYMNVAFSLYSKTFVGMAVHCRYHGDRR